MARSYSYTRIFRAIPRLRLGTGCLAALALGFGVPAARAAEGDAGKTIILRHTEGGQVVEYRFTTLGDQARLERLNQTRPPSPVNLIDRKTGALTILRPHNQSRSTLPSAAFDPPRTAGPGPRLPDGIGARIGPPGMHAPSEPTLRPAGPVAPPEGTPRRVGPDPALLPEGARLPEIPEMESLRPDIPSLPAMPRPPVATGIPERRPGPSGGMPGGMPGMALGGMPGGMPGATPAGLVEHAETREIHGYPCRRHTLAVGLETEMELWLAESPDLPPFYLLTWDGPPRFGARELMLDWPHVVRRTGKFPLLVVRRPAARPGGRIPGLPETATGVAADIPPAAAPPAEETARWEVVVIEPATPEPGLFKIPENYLDPDAPRRSDRADDGAPAP